MSTVIEELVREIASVARVSITRQQNGWWWVSAAPNGHPPLMWYGNELRLEDALDDCKRQAVRDKFLKDVH